MALEAGCDEVNARVPIHQPEVKLDTIMMADLTVKDSTGGKCAFHEKKARDHGGWHLGGGSFGEVYKAVHAVHGDVAVKLAKSGKEHRAHVVMYQKEAQKHVLALTSKRIVSIIGFVQCEDDACNCGLIGIVMEYMKNGSLWDFRTSKWQDCPDLWPLTNRMVYQISSGMHFLHSKDIIHRDLKLDNVLVDGNLNVKVADLGLATNLQTSFGDKCLGTNSHKPPEAFRTDLPNSTKVVTPEYDIYSFAMTLYELLTGIHPYSDRGFYMMMLLKVHSKQSPCLQPVPGSTPKDLIRVMEQSWSYEPNDRPNFREITDLVANLDTDPTHESLGHYLGEQRSSKKEGSADKESVRRGMENFTEQDQAPSRHQSNTNAAVHDAQPVIDNESVRRGIEDLTVNDDTPVEQSNGNTAIPITETVTQNPVEGHESHPPHLGQDNVVAPPEIQHSQPSSQDPSYPSSFGQLTSQISGPQYACHDDNLQRPVEATQSMKFTGFVSAPTENSPGPSVSQPLQSYREDNKPVPVESSHGNAEYAVGHTTGGPIHQGFKMEEIGNPRSPEPDSRWTCKTCTLINSGQVDSCQACEAPRPEDEPVVVDLTKRDGDPGPGQPSPARDVSMLRAAKNHISDQIIPGIINSFSPPSSPRSQSEFSTSRDEEPLSPRKGKGIRVELKTPATSSSKGWLCQRCTFTNEEIAMFCGMCAGRRLPFIPTEIPDHLISPSVLDPGTVFPFPEQPTGAEKNSFPPLNLQSDIRGASGGTSPESLFYASSSSSSPVSTTLEGLDDLTEEDVEPTSPNPGAVDGTNKKYQHRTAVRQKGWSCQQCTLHNEENCKKCKACGSRKSIQHEINGSLFQPKENEWACHVCTYINLDEMVQCCMCETQRPSVSGAVGGAAWNCSVCKTINPDEAASCQKCSNEPFMDGETTVQRKAFKGQKSVMTESRRKQDVAVALERINTIRQSCKMHNTEFIDYSFPPTRDSLFFTSSSGKQPKDFRWRRPSEVQLKARDDSPLPWEVFRNPKPSDLSQGLLGNGWFLSALSVLAERADLLKRIMITHEVNPEGAYQVWLCRDGIWDMVLVDDLLPCQERGFLVYSKAKRKQLWVPLIEKALAKMSGCYEALTAGRCIEGLATLTGAPCESVQLHASGKGRKPADPHLVWAQLLSAKEAGYLMGASCGSGNMKIDPQLYQDVGLRPRHAYSVLDIQDICDNRLIQLRNPWGYFSWNGAWSDGSALWTDIMKEALMAHGASEGIFWMSLGDMIKYFNCIDICKVRPEWSENRLAGTFLPSSATPMKVIILKVTEATEVDFTLYQTWRL